MKKITLLVPCFNEEASLPLLYEQLLLMMEIEDRYQWEILFINDGSSDHTSEVLRTLRQRDSRIAFISLSRNFGKERAMLAGFDYASGDCVVIIDADLQHPPSLIPDMLKYWEEGYQDVYARRMDRGQESFLRRRLTLLYYRMLDNSTRFDVLQNVGDFRLLDRKCVNALKTIRETQRYTKGMYCWIGFRKKEILFEQHSRIAGKSSWAFLSLVNLAIEGLISFTTTPLRISTVCGFVCALAAILYMCYVLAKTLLVGEPVQGFPTIIILMLFLGGMQLFSLGIIGEYLGRIFYETKHRPVYIIDEAEGVNECNGNG